MVASFDNTQRFGISQPLFAIELDLSLEPSSLGLTASSIRIWQWFETLQVILLLWAFVLHPGSGSTNRLNPQWGPYLPPHLSTECWINRHHSDFRLFLHPFSFSEFSEISFDRFSL